jgi:phage terminase small subunit
MPKRVAELTDKERRFVEEYLVDLCATAAALRAGYAPGTARNAEKVKTKPAVRDAIDRAMAERSKRTGVNADRVIRELATVAFAKVSDVAEWGGDGESMRLLPSAQLADEDLRAIAMVSDVEKYIKTLGKNRAGQRQDLLSRERSFKMHDKNKALELLMRHLNLLGTGREGVGGGGPGSVNDAVQALVKAYTQEDWDAMG